MIRVVLFSALVAYQGAAPPKGPDEPKVAAQPKADETARAALLAKYEEMRSKAAETAPAQSKLAAWCEQNGLKDEATIHLANVVRLDPRRDAVWRKLGFKKHEGRWMTDEMIAAEAAQRKTDKEWGDKLKAAHKHIHGGKKQAEAEEALSKITDGAAVPAIYREFYGGGSRDQLIAIQLLGQIEAPVASKVLATLAVYGKSPEVRRRSIETLRRRPAEDFLDLFVALLHDLFRFEVRPVGGPGSPGVLFVEGEQFNVQRFYAPPAPPTITPRPGDQITYDAYGMPVITRPTGGTGQKIGVPGSKTLVYENDPAVQFSLRQQMIESQRAATSAQQQLIGDVARVEQMNEERKRFNDLVMDIAKDATGKNPGKDPKDWRELVAKKDDKYAKRPSKKPTLSELVPLDYNPVFTQQTFLTKVVADS